MTLREQATDRWRTHTSAAGLTWGVMLDGGPLVAALARHVRLDDAAILEIGPGYGRLLRALTTDAIRSGIRENSGPDVPSRPDFSRGRLRASAHRGPGAFSFRNYVGLDISAHWTRQLAAEFGQFKNVELVQGAAEDADMLLAGRKFDVIVSLLTWKHLYPDFSAVARCCHKLLAADGRLIFDLPETGVAWPAGAEEPTGQFEQETGAFTRTYSRAEVDTLLDSAGLTVAAFDEIEHAPDKNRLLIVASQNKLAEQSLARKPVV